MKFYLAPMEGLTGFVFRNAYQKHFGDIDTYFTPFINNKKMNYKEIKDILPCLLYTSPSPRDRQKSRMPSSA